MNQAKQNSSAAVPIMDAEAIRRAIRRIAHEIIERNPQLAKVVLVGIPSRGVEVAERIAAFIHEIEEIDIETGAIDVAMHRDDVGTRAELPVVRASKLPVPLEERTVIVVDDVLFTGRPIRADYVGKNLPTAANEKVRVRIGSADDADGVWLIKPEGAG